MRVSINSNDKLSIRNSILANMGNYTEFSNGCSIDLKDDNGIMWGETPYGITWACNTDKDPVSAIITWIEYWDDPRTESGDLIATNSLYDLAGTFKNGGF